MYIKKTLIYAFFALKKIKKTAPPPPYIVPQLKHLSNKVRVRI